MKVLKKIWSYITLQSDPNAKGNSYLKGMHTMNKISILMFLVGLAFLLSKCVR
jgi:hypothetical protein